MKSRCFSSTLAWIACVGMVLPSAAFATPPSKSVPVVDVELSKSNTLVGKVLTDQGAPSQAQTVTLSSQLGSQTAVTNADGSFAFDGVQGGAYELATQQSSQMVRAWQYQTAPPAATHQVMLISNESVVRGQHPGFNCATCDPGYGGAPPAGGGFHWLANPWIIGVAVAVAIAVPVALSDDDDDSAS